MDTSNFEGLLVLSRAAKSIPPAERASAVEGLYATGHWLLSQDRFANAADVLRAMTLVAPEDERGWVALGAAHEGVAQLEVAKEIYAAGYALAKPNADTTDDELSTILAYERAA